MPLVKLEMNQRNFTPCQTRTSKAFPKRQDSPT